MSKKVIIRMVILFILTVFACLLFLVFKLNRQINLSLERGWFQAPVELYSSPIHLKKNQALTPEQLTYWLKYRDYTSVTKQKPQDLRPKEFMSSTECLDTSTDDMQMDLCITWRNFEKQLYQVSFFNKHLTVLKQNDHSTDQIVLQPVLFARYEQEQAILKQIKKLNQFPLHCLQAVMAAEDHQFITHEGISFKGIARAIWKNLMAGRMSQGASTITQQLIKNIFLHPKKTLWRKFKEQLMAVLIETKLNKDQILELYLNVIYMSQVGVFQVHGFGASALHYIGKPVENLNVSECALIAGLIKSPGRYNPFKNPETSLKRRNHVLENMYNNNFITQAQWQKAKLQKLPVDKKYFSQHTAYFTDTVYRKLKEYKLSTKKGLKVFTTWRPMIQNTAASAVQSSLKWLDRQSRLQTSRQNQKQKDKKNQEQKDKQQEEEESLQTALISVDISTGAVLSIIGGRDFTTSQFNRAVQAKRQIGSLIKPFVVLNALIQIPDLNPLSALQDERFIHKYENQEWNPKNYKDKYHGQVPLYKALSLSLNSAIARLGLQTELSSLTKLIEKSGGPVIKEKHPSLFLGAVELTPWEVAQMYLTIAGMGQHRRPHIIKEVQTLNGKILYTHLEKEPTHTEIAKPSLDVKKTAVLIGMLKQTPKSGTAQSLKDFPVPVAGKTGTTNDTRDAWFAGWTPEVLTVVWVGFDNNMSHGLTGASGALPIWKHFMTKNLSWLSSEDFSWPKGVKEKQVLPTDIDISEDMILIEDPKSNEPESKEPDNKNFPLIFEN